MDCRQYEITPNEFAAEIYYKKQRYYIVVELELASPNLNKKGVYIPKYETLVNASNPGQDLHNKFEDKIFAFLEYRIGAFDCLLDYLKDFKEEWHIIYNKNPNNSLSLEIDFKSAPDSKIPLCLEHYLRSFKGETVITIPIPNQINSSTPISESVQKNSIRILKDAADFIYYPSTWAAFA